VLVSANTSDIADNAAEIVAIKADIEQVIYVTTTIQAAIDAAEEGNIVVIPPGTYNEAVNLNKRIYLVGHGDDTILTSSTAEDVVRIGAPSGTDSVNRFGIQHLTVQGDGIAGQSGIATVALPQNLDIIDIKFVDCDLYGLDFNSSGTIKNVMLDRLRFENCGVGIKSGGGTSLENLTLMNSQIIGDNSVNQIGLYSTAGAQNWSILNCEISQNGLHGVYFGIIDGLLIENTKFYNNGGQVTAADESSAIKFSGHTNEDVKNGVIRNCIFERNGEGTSAFTGDDIGNGLLFVGSGTPCLVQNWLIENCRFENNRHTGVRAYGKSGAVVNNITIRNSRFLNNGNVNGSFGVYTVYSGSPAGTIDADECYWGADDGPGGVGPGNGNAVSLQVSYANWLTRYNIPANDVVNDSAVTGVSVKNALDNLKMDVDANTAIAHTHSNQAELDLITDGDHDARTDNPHVVDKIDVGLSNVPNLDTTNAVSWEHQHSNKAELDLVTDGDHDVRADNPHIVTNTQVGLSNVLNVAQIPATEKGAVSGVATLDGTGKHLTSEIPDNIKNQVLYKGLWNAAINSPALSNSGGGGVQGDYYKVSVAGNTSIDGINDWRIGDFITHNGTSWDKTNNYRYLDPAYGELYENTPAGTAISLALAGSFYGWVSASSGLFKSGVVAFTDDATADRITIVSAGGGAGIYDINVVVSFSGSANEQITGVVHLNGSPVSKLYFRRKLNSNGDVGSASIAGKLTLSENDYIDLRFSAANATKTISIHFANLSITRINY
jgi:hypothetical protein